MYISHLAIQQFLARQPAELLCLISFIISQEIVKGIAVFLGVALHFSSFFFFAKDHFLFCDEQALFYINLLFSL
jgi:hypothetical protein